MPELRGSWGKKERSNMDSGLIGKIGRRWPQNKRTGKENVRDFFGNVRSRGIRRDGLKDMFCSAVFLLAEVPVVKTCSQCA